MTRREQNLYSILATLFRLHRDGNHEGLAAGMKLAEVVLINPSPVQCEGVALDITKLSPPPKPAMFAGGVFFTPGREPVTPKAKS